MKNHTLILALFLGIFNIANAQITLPWHEGFEGTGGETYLKTTNSIIGVPFASYIRTDTGRLRTKTSKDFYHSGSRAATLDGITPSATSPVQYLNYLIFTLDLSSYVNGHFDFSFYYAQHSDAPHPSDKVWARGNTNNPWVLIYDWQNNPPQTYSPTIAFSQPAIFKKATVRLSKILADSNQTISSSTQIRFGQMGHFKAVNPTAYNGLTIDDLEITEVAQNDAAIIASLNKPICNSNTNITIELKNLGLDTLKNAVINWTINGALQNSFKYNDTLARGEIDTLQLGISNIPSTQSLVFWVDSVNGVVDNLRYNDTLKIDLAPALNGTYSVAGMSPDFPNLSSALQYARNHGICNSARLEVRQGTYSERLDFSNIEGNLEVVADPANSSEVIFQAHTSSDTAVATFYNSKHITLDSLHLKSLSGTGSVVSMSGINSNLTFTNSIFESVPTITDTIPVFKEPFRFDNTTDTVLIENNQILNGSISILASGDHSSDKYWIIRNNQLMDWHHKGIEIKGIDGLEISQNQITDANKHKNPVGVYVNECPSLILRSNKLDVGGSGNPFGIQTMNCDGQGTKPVFVENNMVVMSSSETSSATGISVINGRWSSIYHNSVNIISAGKNSKALYISGSPTYNVSNYRVLNNNLCNFGKGYALFGSSFVGLDTCDYNNLYSKGDNIAYWSGPAKSLFDLRLNSLNDFNSISSNPEFTSMRDLHSKSHALDSSALVVAASNTDIDGNSRNTAFPDIGADEFILNTNDLKVKEILIIDYNVCPKSNASIDVSIRNVGTAPQSGFNVYVKLNGATYSQIYNDILYGGENDTLQITGVNLSNIGSYGLVAYTALVNDQDRSDDTLHLKDSIQVLASANPPKVSNDTICKGEITNLFAQNNSLKNRWFLSSKPDSMVYIGDSLQISGITNATTFEVESFNYVQESVGDTDAKFNTPPYPNYSSGLNFDVNSHEVVIDSVTIYPTGTGWVRIHIVDNLGNVILSSDTFNVIGASSTKMRVPLGFSLPYGNYSMTLESSGLTRLGRSFSVIYPLTSASGAVSILECLLYGTGTLYDYLYFFDWAIYIPSCPSPRVTVNLEVNTATQPNLTPIQDLCNNEPPLTLSGGTPVGGVYLINGDTAQQFKPIDHAPGVYSLTYLFNNQDNCMADSTVTFQLKTTPNVSLSSFDSICENSNNVSLTGGLPLGGKYLVDGIQNSVIDPSIGAGNYRIEYTYTDTNNCADTATENFTINPLPSILLADTIEVCGKEIAILDPGTHSSYHWITGDTSRTLKVQYSGEFEVTVTSNLGCQSTKSVFVNRNAVCTDIFETSSSLRKARLFPNPTNDDDIILEINGAIGDVSLHVSSLNGKAVLKKSLKTVNGKVSEKIDVSQLKNGIYMFQITDNVHTVYHRAIIAR